MADFLKAFMQFRADAARGICPTCGLSTKGAKFKDDLSRREHEISGLCQPCQDSYFAPQPEDKLP